MGFSLGSFLSSSSLILSKSFTGGGGEARWDDDDERRLLLLGAGGGVGETLHSSSTPPGDLTGSGGEDGCPAVELVVMGSSSSSVTDTFLSGREGSRGSDGSGGERDGSCSWSESAKISSGT